MWSLPRDGNEEGLGQDTPIPFMSQSYNPSPSLSQTRVGACWWVPILVYRKNDKPIPACLNPNMYFCLNGEEDDFLKTNNITLIHKISNEQIHNFHAYTLFWKKQKTPQKFLEIAMAFKNKILGKKQMNRPETARFTLGAIRDASWLSNQNSNYKGKNTQIFHTKKIKYFYTIQPDKTLKYK